MTAGVASRAVFRTVPGAAGCEDGRARDQAGAQHHALDAGADPAQGGTGSGEGLRSREVRREAPLRHGTPHPSPASPRAPGGQGRRPRRAATAHRQGDAAGVAAGLRTVDARTGHRRECHPKIRARPNKARGEDAFYRTRRHACSYALQEQIDVVKRELRATGTISDPAKTRLLETREAVVAAWNAVASKLEAQGEVDLGDQVRYFARHLPPVRTDREPPRTGDASASEDEEIRSDAGRRPDARSHVGKIAIATAPTTVSKQPDFWTLVTQRPGSRDPREPHRTHDKHRPRRPIAGQLLQGSHALRSATPSHCRTADQPTARPPLLRGISCAPPQSNGRGATALRPGRGYSASWS